MPYENISFRTYSLSFVTGFHASSLAEGGRTGSLKDNEAGSFIFPEWGSRTFVHPMGWMAVANFLGFYFEYPSTYFEDNLLYLYELSALLVFGASPFLLRGRRATNSCLS